MLLMLERFVTERTPNSGLRAGRRPLARGGVEVEVEAGDKPGLGTESRGDPHARSYLPTKTSQWS